MPKASSSSQANHRRPSLPPDPDGDSFSQDDSPENPPSPRTAALMRKRKNADAQAAFRARRANYIANLEETVTSLENAVRRLQDALRDARLESTELKTENQRFIALLENAGIDHRLASSSTDGSSLLQPPATNSLHGSPNHGPEFALQYSTAGLSPGLSPNLPSEQPQQSSVGSSYSPYFNTPNSLSPEYLTHQNLSTHPSAGQHARQLSTESQGRMAAAAAEAAAAAAAASSPGYFETYGIARPASAASVTSSHSSTHSFHGAFDKAADVEPVIPGSKSAPTLQMGFNDMNLYGGAIAAMGVSAPAGGAGSSIWNSAFLSVGGSGDQENSPSPSAQQPSKDGDEQETDLERSNTVKASRHLHQRTHSHLALAPVPTLPSIAQRQPQSIGMDNPQLSARLPVSGGPPQQQQQPPADVFSGLVDDTNSAYEFDPYGLRHSRPGSSASSLPSNEGEIGHPGGHYAIQQQQHHLPQHLQQHMSGGDLDDGAYYSSEGDFNDLDYMEGMEGMDGPGATGADGLALVDSFFTPGSYGSLDPSGLSTSPFANGFFGNSPGSSPGIPAAMAAGMGNGGIAMGFSSGNGNGLNMRSRSISAAAPMGSSGTMPLNLTHPGAASDALLSGHGGPGGGISQQQVPMSSTLAVIKAQAFGTSRKARTRAKRPGADSAAKVAMEALQARAQGLGLDVDLTVEGDGAGGAGSRMGGASMTRSGATVKRRPKVEEQQPTG